MDESTALRAIEDQLPDFPFEIGFHVQQLKAEHLRLQGERVRSVKASLERLLHNGASRGCLLADDPNRVLKDLAVPAWRNRR